ncbi:hypothetical protein [uncultured Nevskia sp.]|uniref:class I SAM-dependent methyltransferase n=1 Tax=uncultured Nevskia sp. TaxID=228950 RepID=UPI0025CF0D76|nr:hypothetical protein [uncultured Nevskia sp.]
MTRSTVTCRSALRGMLVAAVAMLPLLADAAESPAAIPAYVVAAVADPSRPDSDRQRDADRKPAEVIAFAGIKPGDKLADLMPGRGYYTRIFCKLVGDGGHVYAIAVPFKRSGPLPADKPAEAVVGEPCGNVTATSLQPRMVPAPELWSSSDDPGGVYEYWAKSPAAENFTAAEPLDVIWTSENYHDLHNPAFGSPNLLTVGIALLNALKPGGILIVEDHAAEPGSGARDTETLHRIDPAEVKRELLAAGFAFVAESPVLRHADDPHIVKAHAMHDRTDRFLLKFRKP